MPIDFGFHLVDTFLIIEERDTSIWLPAADLFMLILLGLLVA